jgi:site-specific DNA-methyltransferase (adenine-specific)
MSDQLGGLIDSEHTHNPGRDQELRFCPLTLRARWKRNVAQRGDALELLKTLPDACAALAFFDPQHRGVLDKLKFGNEGARQRERWWERCDRVNRAEQESLRTILDQWGRP